MGDLLLLLGGLVLLLGGGEMLVRGASALARELGVSPLVVGLTVVAFGTSAPELAVNVTAAWRGDAGLAFGNVVGSNVFNLLGILGVTALVTPLPVPEQILRVDLWVMGAATALLVAAAVTGLRVTRGEGAGLLALFVGYMVWTVT